MDQLTKDATYLAIIFLQVCVIIYFARRGRKQTNSAFPNEGLNENTFEGHRRLALSVTLVQLNLTIPDNVTFVYGVVMDWNTGDNIVTLASYITGAANLYLSSGGGVSGGGMSPAVGESAVKLVALAAEYVGRAVPATSTKDLPAPGCVRFYLLANKQIYCAQEQVQYLDDGSSPWLTVFQKGNDVIAAMRP